MSPSSATPVTSASDSAAGGSPRGAASQWVVFSCAGHLFGVPVGQVREIVPGRPPTPIPGCGAAVAGLVNLRGRVLTVFDFGASFDLTAEAPGHLLLVLEREHRPSALAVDRVLAIAHAPEQGLAVGERALRTLDVPVDEVLGVGDWEGRAFLAVDAAAILERLWG